jgi:hypothetical protein
VRKAALADKEAAARIARLYREGEGANRAATSAGCSTPRRSATRPASYELAVHYRKSDQPALAAPYEAPRRGARLRAAADARQRPQVSGGWRPSA